MITLADKTVRAELTRRIDLLKPDAQRRWGKMNPHQMLCHLNDSFLGVTGVRPIKPAGSFLMRQIIKYIALYSPGKWPQGAQTLPEVDQMVGGTPPAEWDRDRNELLRLIEWFADPATAKVTHPLFGDMTPEQWLRWGYLHVDHHLRQFGV